MNRPCRFADRRHRLAVVMVAAVAAACGGQPDAGVGGVTAAEAAAFPTPLRRSTRSRRACAARWTSRSPATSTPWSSAGYSCRRDLQPHALLHRPRAGTRHHLRGAQVVRERPQRRPEDRQPQGARRAGADVAQPAASGPRQGHRGHGRGDGDGAAGTGTTGRVLGTDPHRGEPGGGHRPGRAADCRGRRSCRPDGVRPQGEPLLRDPHPPEPGPGQAGQAGRGDRGGARSARGRRHPRDGQRRPGADHRRRRLPGGVLAAGLHRPDRAPRRGGADRRPARGGVPQGLAAAARGRQPVDPEARQGRRVPQRHRAPLPQGPAVRQKRRRRSGAPQAPGDDRAVQEVRRPIRPGLPADGRPGLPGVDAGSERPQQGGRDRRHAGHAADRQGAEGRRRLQDRPEHPRRREVHAVHDRHLLQGRADGPAQQGADGLCLLQRRAGAGAPVAPRGRKARARSQRVVR